MSLSLSHTRTEKPRTFYELLGDGQPYLTGRLQHCPARLAPQLTTHLPRTGHELDSHSKKIRCSRAAPTLDYTLAALLKANPTSLAASQHCPARLERPN